MLIANRQKRTVIGDTVLNLQCNDIDKKMTTSDEVLVCLSVCLSVGRSVGLSVCLSVCLSKPLFSIGNCYYCAILSTTCLWKFCIPKETSHIF